MGRYFWGKVFLGAHGPLRLGRLSPDPKKSDRETQTQQRTSNMQLGLGFRVHIGILGFLGFTYSLHVVPFFGLTKSILSFLKGYPQKGTTMETIGIE